MSRGSRRPPPPDARPITARPRAPEEGFGYLPPESGLSVEPEDLGAQFLCSATEGSSDFPPALLEGENLEESILAEDGLDEASFEDDPWGWERRITRSLRALTERGRELAPRTSRRPTNLPPELPSRFRDELDLTEESVRESSLLDREGDELGEVESPFLRTDDSHSHGRPRGGHVRHNSPTKRPGPRGS